ncbi:hypothetical protein JY651_16375 [Pyxidicoccus parkwayensis]|uniref:Uncharacterized protein n=1 Tax=Pyxidicoccus parkwayensis TaxID=2813578 RepID=A0ABX7P7G7_9BACT|nr:hypothetical protein [Pyxidicoccus parkwaysis]QSQ26405.1 hypothetical protein JY651_16375 [Pyxidicoccus parkwaysis]
MRAIGSSASSSSAHISNLARHQGNQLNRIQKGIGDGSLTADEAKGLMGKQASIADAKRNAMADGSIDKKEFKQLRRMQRQASRDIFEQRHNAAGGSAAHGPQGHCGTSTQGQSGTSASSGSSSVPGQHGTCGTSTQGQSGTSTTSGSSTSGQSGTSTTSGSSSSGQSGTSTTSGSSSSGQSGTSTTGGSSASDKPGTCDGVPVPGTGTSGGSVASDLRASCVGVHQGNQRNRILNGLRDGSINAGEAGGLMDLQNRIAEAKGSAMADGSMSETEYNQLRQLQHEASIRIFNARHNGGIRW